MTDFLRVLGRLTDGIAIAANAVGTLVVLGLVAIVNYDAAARSFFNAPFLGAVEVVQFSMVLIVFLQLPDVCRVDRLTRSDGFLTLMSSRRPLLARGVRRVINGLSMIFMILVAYAIWPEFLKMWETQDFFGVPGVFTAPWWPVKLVIFGSAVLCALVLGLKVIRGSDTAAVRGPEGDTP